MIYEAHLMWKGRETDVTRDVNVDFDEDDALNDLTVVLAAMIRADGGGRWDLPDYALELHDGDPGTPTVLFATDEWPD